LRIGVPREIKDNEHRVGLTPASVAELVANGHRVLVEQGAGVGSGLPDDAYARAGAQLQHGPGDIFETCDLIVKVKEPQEGETRLLRPGQMLFTYLHLAPDPALTRALMDSGATCVAYETVTSPTGGLPLLTPIIAVVMTFSVLFTFTDFQLIYVITRGGPLNATHLMATLSFQRAISGGALGEGAAIAIAMVPFLLAAILFSYFGLQRRAWQQGGHDQ
jgi:alanine dehydrogenase